MSLDFYPWNPEVCIERRLPHILYIIICLIYNVFCSPEKMAKRSFYYVEISFFIKLQDDMYLDDCIVR